MNLLLTLIVLLFIQGQNASARAEDLNPSAHLCALLLNGPYFASLPKTLPFCKQDVNGKCGPTSLGIALGYFGRVAPQSNDPFAIANQMTALTIQVAKTLITPEIRQAVATLVAQKALPMSESLLYSVMINGTDVLAATARLHGLYAIPQTANLSQISNFVAAGEVILVHWWSGPGPMDDHWSVLQNIGPQTLELRDPWPTSPSIHVKSTNEFYARAKTNTPGVFTIVRISDHIIY